MLRNVFFHCSCVVLACLGLAGAWSQEAAESTATETVLGKIDPVSWIKETVVVSPDATKLAYVARADGKQRVVVDGQEGKLYDEIVAGRIRACCIVFSPDGKRVAYVARSGGKSLVVVDGTEGKPYDEIDMDYILFSPDSKRTAYRARAGTEWVVVVDSQESKRYAGLGSREVSYKRGRITYGVICGPPLAFSPDGTRLAYLAALGGKWFVVVDGREGKHYDNVVMPERVFSPDGKRTAYWGRVGDKWHGVVDGKEGKPHDGPGIAAMAENYQLAILATGSLVFSPDSRRFAYVAQEGDEELEFALVVDGQEWSRYDYVDTLGPVFSPDSTTIAYIVRSQGNEFKESVVVDKQRGTPYEGVLAPVFSPDSGRIAYPAYDGTKWFVVLDGQEGKRYDYVGTPYSSGRSAAGLVGFRRLIFSPDSKRLAYGAQVGDKWLVVVDGEEGKQYDEIGMCGLVFSPDSRAVAYAARAGKEWFVVVGDRESKHYSEMPGPIVFESPEKLRYVVEDDTICRVEETLQ